LKTKELDYVMSTKLYETIIVGFSGVGLGALVGGVLALAFGASVVIWGLVGAVFLGGVFSHISWQN
jgi:carbon starvation protein CstA